MTSIKDVRVALDSELDKLQAKAEASAAQISLTNDELNQYISEQKEKLSSASVKLQEKLNEVTAEDARVKIQGAVDHLQVQLALGEADTRDAFNAMKKEIQSAIANFNAELDATEKREATAELDALIQIYVAQSIALETELEVMEEQYQEKQG